MDEPTYNGKTSREIMKELAYQHLLYDKPESLLLEDWCKTPRQFYGEKTPSLSPLLPHRIVAKMIEEDSDHLSELGMLMSWCLTCEYAISVKDVNACVDMILETPILNQYHELTRLFHKEFEILLALRKNERVSLEWKDVPEPQLTAISNTSCLGHSLQECIDRYFGTLDTFGGLFKV